MRTTTNGLTCVELCAGAGGQALGLEMAGFDHVRLVELEEVACGTLRLNRPNWDVVQGDIREFDGTPYRGIDLLAGGLPCPPFSIAGKQLGEKDERNLFPAAFRLVEQMRPRAVMFENVRGILGRGFSEYRNYIASELRNLGYGVDWKLLEASDFGVPQLRPRVVFVGFLDEYRARFSWPRPRPIPSLTVGESLFDQMAAGGWPGAEEWRTKANKIAPTIVGGSTKHGGPDLGPTRAKRAWAALGVNGHGIADDAPGPDFVGQPKLTIPMVARLQGFPDSWRFAGRKTKAYRQVGNAFPPPVAQAVAEQVAVALGVPAAIGLTG